MSEESFDARLKAATTEIWNAFFPVEQLQPHRYDIAYFGADREGQGLDEDPAIAGKVLEMVASGQYSDLLGLLPDEP